MEAALNTMRKQQSRGFHAAVCLSGTLVLGLQLTACKSAPVVVVAPVAVPVATVRRSSLTNNLTLTGEFTPYQSIDVMSKVAGFVKIINVDIGDHVKQGQVLANARSA